MTAPAPPPDDAPPDDPLRLAQDRAAALERELQAARQALQEGEERYRLLWQATADVVLIVDGHSRILFANPATQEVLGHAPDGLIGQSLAVLQPPHLHAAHQAGMTRYLRDGQRRANWRGTETLARHADGHDVPVELSFSDLSVRGEPVFAAFMRDISARRRAEAERQTLQSQLAQAQKMEAVGVLAGGIAHDFNNVVAAILGNEVLARDELPAGHPVTDRLAAIRRAGLRARELVRQLLAFSRQQPAERRLCDAGALMAEAMALLKAALPAGVHLEGELPEVPLPLMADPTQVVQSLINLGTNAWQALGARSGHVRFRALRVAADAHGVPRPARPAAASDDGPAPDWVCLEVADDGPGIPPELHSRIFDPFFTTKPLGEGTGLGLSVVHGMVTGHGGGVTLDSAPGRGTVFRLWLPAAVASLLPPADAPHATLPAPGGPDGTPGARVLYVDDDEVLALMVAQLLQRAGYAVTTCCDPAQALRTVGADPSAFDVLVTDLNMPEVSGLELAHAAQALRPCLPIILTSGNLPAQLGLWDGEPRPPLPFATLPKEEVAEGLVPLVARCLQQARAGAPPA